jgi:hypothetical protein
MQPEHSRAVQPCLWSRCVHCISPVFGIALTQTRAKMYRSVACGMRSAMCACVSECVRVRMSRQFIQRNANWMKSRPDCCRCVYSSTSTCGRVLAVCSAPQQVGLRSEWGCLHALRRWLRSATLEHPHAPPPTRQHKSAQRRQPLRGAGRECWRTPRHGRCDTAQRGHGQGRSRRRCGPVPAQMWAGPGADVGRSRRRCGPTAIDRVASRRQSGLGGLGVLIVLRGLACHVRDLAC